MYAIYHSQSHDILTITQWQLAFRGQPSLTEEPALFYFMNPDFNQDIYEITLTSNFMSDMFIFEGEDKSRQQIHKIYRYR